jgi:cytochrome c-type biogenesis protein
MYTMDPFLIGSVFLAGLVMFLAPCTLPLLPAYLGFISGVSEEQLRDEGMRALVRRRVVKNSILFVLGFSCIFILFGILAGVVGGYVGPLRTVLTKVGGVLISVFGLLTLGVIRPNALVKEYRVHMPSWLRVGTPSASFALGASFAFGWTPCIGPILATVLLFASSTDTLAQGALLLCVFSIGFSIPFVALAYMISQATRFVERISPYIRTVSMVGGMFMVFLGVFLVVGDLSYLTSWIFRVLGALDYESHLLRFL